MSDFSSLGAAWPHLNGAAQFSLLAWTAVALLVVHGLLGRLNVTAWARGIALALSLPLCVLAAWWLRGTFGDLALLSLAALAVAVWRALARPTSAMSLGMSQRPKRSTLTIVLAAMVALLGWVLYANLLGLGAVDLYAWGDVDEPQARQALLNTVGHANLWALVLDPFAVLAATSMALRGGLAAHRQRG
ncbi:hypothetical protein [Ideonella sp.]|jgi:hypothetical protein|uniref:hypothetical protein n=1 Tax=Ideonella sp. TaxID=1929293 RepID=UPI0037C18492